MKVEVLVSLVLMVSVTAVPAPSRRKVKLPSDPSGNTGTKTTELYESYLKWKETLPEGSDDSFATFISWVENGSPQSETATEYEDTADELAQREQQKQYPIAGQMEDLAERELQDLSQTEINANDFNQREQQDIFPIEGETDFSQRQEEEESPAEEEAGENVNQMEINDKFPIEEETDFSQRHEEESSLAGEEAGEDVNRREINEKFTIEEERDFSQRHEEESSLAGEEAGEDVNQMEINEKFPIEEEIDFSQRHEEEEYPAEEEAGKDVGQREQKEVGAGLLPVSDENEKSDVFDCETNSPCTADNAVKELFYFAAKDPKKFIQCSAFGSCSEMPCREGLAWNDEFKTCN